MASEREPIRVGNAKQVFLDALFFAARRGVALGVNPPADAGEALRADRPWESQGIIYPRDVVLAPDELDAVDGAVHGPFLIVGECIDKDRGGQRYGPDLPPEKWVWFTDRVDDLRGVDFYNQPVTQYPWAERAYVMPFSILRHRADLEEIQLAVSRDGIRWDRPGDRQAWIRPPVDEHAGYLYCGPGILRHGPWIDRYCVRMAAWHGGGKPGAYERIPMPPCCGSVRRARLRLDGYVSADAGSAGGEFVTPPLVYCGARLELNVDTGASGWIEVGILPLEYEGPVHVAIQQRILGCTDRTSQPRRSPRRSWQH